MTVLVLVLFALAVARVSRLIGVDKIFEPFRMWAVKRWGNQSMRAYLVHCLWCLSIWVGFAAAPFAVWLAGLSWWYTPLVALAASQVAGMSARFSD